MRRRGPEEGAHDQPAHGKIKPAFVCEVPDSRDDTPITIVAVAFHLATANSPMHVLTERAALTSPTPTISAVGDPNWDSSGWTPPL